jgi:4'-phosphopantetheinyl transferase
LEKIYKMVSLLFNSPPLNLQLANDEIHIWCASLDQPASLVNKLACTLSIEEKRRAARFYFEKDRKWFINRHGILRMILGYYLGTEANELKFCHGKNGKPGLAHSFEKGIILFSMSSSQGLALYGFARNREIGVDIECVRDLPDMDQLAEVIFSRREAQICGALPTHLKREAFFTYWTRKEAFVKATGEGLSQPLDKSEPTVHPGRSARLSNMDGESGRAFGFSIFDLKPASGFAAAIAARGESWRLRCWEWARGDEPQINHLRDGLGVNGVIVD